MAATGDQQADVVEEGVGDGRRQVAVLQRGGGDGGGGGGGRWWFV